MTPVDSDSPATIRRQPGNAKPSNGGPDLSPRGLVIGAICGAAFGILSMVVGTRAKPLQLSDGGQVLLMLLVAGHFAFVGGFAGGFVKRTGWTILLYGDHHLDRSRCRWRRPIPTASGDSFSASVPRSFWARSPGGYLGYRMGIHWESQKPDWKAPGRTKSTSLWDREIDG